LEAHFCAGNSCGPNRCCGGVRYDRQEGGTQILNIAVPTALACISCTAGCGACAGTTAATLLQAEMKMQIDSILQALKDTETDLGNAASEWGQDLSEQLVHALEVIVKDIVRDGRINMDGAGEGQFVNFGNCKLSTEPGMATFSSKTCAWCCNCVPNANAMRMYLTWSLDCRLDNYRITEIPK
jgi:hypothetical protein